MIKFTLSRMAHFLKTLSQFHDVVEAKDFHFRVRMGQQGRRPFEHDHVRGYFKVPRPRQEELFTAWATHFF